MFAYSEAEVPYRGTSVAVYHAGSLCRTLYSSACPESRLASAQKHDSGAVILRSSVAGGQHLGYAGQIAVGRWFGWDSLVFGTLFGNHVQAAVHLHVEFHTAASKDRREGRDQNRTE